MHAPPVDAARDQGRRALWRRGAVILLSLSMLTLSGSRPLMFAAAASAQDVPDTELQKASGDHVVRLGSTARGVKTATVPLESYVARVLAGEGEPDAPDATRQALAVAIRTFAVANAGRHRRDGFDLCDTTHCQVPRASTGPTRAAALATAGLILTYNGAPAEVFYSASCGGRSEAASVVWPSARLPYLASVIDDVHGEDEPWTAELTLSDVRAALARAGFAGRRLREVVVEARSESGRVTRLRVAGLRPDAIAGEAFRAAVGGRVVRSTAFTLEQRGETLRLTGYGYGHGIGLCVVGAGRRARRGETVQDILTFYYPGLELRSLSSLTAP